MRILALGWLLLLLVGLTGCSICCTVQECCPRPCAGAGADRIGIDIPDAVHAAVLKAIPGFVATEIEMEQKDGKLTYEFEGRGADGALYEVEVDGQGNVLQIDQEIEGDVDAPGEHDDDEEGPEED